METSPTPPDKTDDEAQKSTNTDGLEHVSALLIELWRDYKSSHLPNLIYSVAFVGGVLTLGNTSELFKRVSEDGRTLIIIAVLLALAAAGLSMMHRFTSQLFMEIETLPADSSMRNYYHRRNSTYKKITYSYGYSSGIIELFKFLHTLTKYLTSLFLYIGWVLFGLALILAFLRPADRPSDFCALADDQHKNRVCGEPTLSYFLDWFVGWLARDFAFGIVLLIIVAVVTLITCWSLRQPNAYKTEKDPMGPIAWPSLMLASVSIVVLAFSFWKNIHVFGISVYSNPAGVAISIFLLTLVGALSIWRLIVRNKNLKQERGDYSYSIRKIKVRKSL